MEDKKFLDELKKKLRPERSKAQFEKTLSSIEKEVKKNKEKAIVVFGGSIAKGTNIKGDFDCDIFIKFPMNYKDKDLSGITEKILKPFSPERVHGSRDYFKFEQNNVKYEVVPVLNIKDTSELINTTDASPLHAEWVRKEIRKKPGLADEIRLTKQFCKAQGLYGAESYIRGFSGHVVDIITIYYGGFINLLKASSDWKKKTIIDFYNIHKGNALDKLNASKIESPLVLIDPIESERNAAASLSDEKFDQFIKSAKSFLKRPDKSFFEKKELSIDDLKKQAAEKKGDLILIEAESLAGKEDIIGTKLLKAYEHIIKQSKLADFPILDSGWMWDKKKKALFWIISQKIEKKKVWPGPPLKVKNSVIEFKKKHKSTFEKEGKIFANVKRKYTDPKEFIKNIIKEEQVKDRVKKIKMV